MTLIAQSGMHLPASFAEVNCFEQVWADIGDEQSIAQSLSTFSGHITTIGRFIANLRPNALVLLDEVGAGTDPGEGAALAIALLEHFRERGARVIATSHYGELKTYAFTTDGVQNASVEFDLTTIAAYLPCHSGSAWLIERSRDREQIGHSARNYCACA